MSLRADIALVLVLGAAIPASADDTVTLRLEGEIPAVCALGTAAGALDLGDITIAGERVFTFAVDCNTPFGFEILSEHGALALERGPAEPGFAAAIAYEFDVTIPLSDGGTAGVTRCASAAIGPDGGGGACRRGTSRGGVAIGQVATATFRWAGAGPLPPRAGNYVDTVQIVLTTVP